MHEKFIDRCIELALCGKADVAPNPMVGSVIVHEGKIIGEGRGGKGPTFLSIFVYMVL